MKKKRTRWIVNFGVPADHRVKLKKSEKKDKYLDLARELKKLWNMKVMVILIAICAVGTVTKGVVQALEDLKIRGWEETIPTTALLTLAGILRRVLETCCHSNFSEKPLLNAGVKNYQRSKIIKIIIESTWLKSKSSGLWPRRKQVWIHFLTNTLEKGINLVIFLIVGFTNVLIDG